MKKAIRRFIIALTLGVADKLTRLAYSLEPWDSGRYR